MVEKISGFGLYRLRIWKILHAIWSSSHLALAGHKTNFTDGKRAFVRTEKMKSESSEWLHLMLAGSLCFAFSQYAFCATDTQKSSHQIEAHPVQVFQMCARNSRMTAADVAIVRSRVTFQVICVNDRSGKSKEDQISGARDFPIKEAKMQSVYASETAAAFNVNVSIDSSGQTAEIKHSDGRPCVVILAVAKSRNPVPRAFTSASNDWRAAIDYMLDKSCSALAIRLGNHLAIMPTQGADSFYLYNISFKKISR